MREVLLGLILFLGLAGGSGVFAAHWALLVAGSSEYYNYRHQSDVFHAFHVLTGRGVPPENIVTMVYDDIANHPLNPFPGQVFNKPTQAGQPGYDVYKGTKRDYTGANVTSVNFLAALSGNVTAAPAGLPVLRSGPDDYVFLMYADHGAPGVSCFPNGDMLYSDELQDTLQRMHDERRYRKMVIYWESCESGSMFEDLPDDLDIYVTTAANPSESSWGTFCPPTDLVNGTVIGACLADEYSSNWLENADRYFAETLERQFQLVRQETKKSHVSQYGALNWTSMPIDIFIGTQSQPQPHIQYDDNGDVPSELWNAREAKLRFLYWQWKRGPTADTLRALDTEVRHRQLVREFFSELVAAVTLGNSDENEQSTLLHSYPTSNRVSPYAKQVISEIANRCLDGRWSEYALKFIKTVLNLDRWLDAHPFSPVSLLSAVDRLCA